MKLAIDTWSDDLTDKQLAMVMESGREGLGVDLERPGAWATALSLEKRGLGHIEGGRSRGSSLPGLYFNDIEGERIAGEFNDEEEEGCGCPECGRHEEHDHVF